MLLEFKLDAECYAYEFLDPLSTASGAHVTGTEQQSESDLWHQIRKLRIHSEK